MYNDSVSEIEGDVKEGVIEMSDSMLKEKVEFISKKHAVSGVVLDYNVVTKLFFTYEGKDIEMAIHKNFLKNETLEEIGSRTIDSYIDNLSNNEKDRKLQLHYWYIEELEDDEEKYMSLLNKDVCVEGIFKENEMDCFLYSARIVQE